MTYALRLTVTLIIIGVAVVLVGWKYRDYVTNPWTRDGQVMADIVEVAPRVSGPIVELAVVDNQFVNAGDLLFRIDPRTYQAALAEAEANLARTEDEVFALGKEVESAEASVEQYKALIPSAEAELRAAASTLTQAERDLERFTILVETSDLPEARLDEQQKNFDVALASKQQAEIALINSEISLSQAEANLSRARAERGRPPPDNSRLNAAAAAVETARLNLEFTEVRASVDGYVTNLDLRLGTQAVAYSPAVALIDVSTYWIDAYFRETYLRNIDPGDQAVVTLMGYPDIGIEGRVESVNWGIAQSDGTTGAGLLPNVSATFEWIRLAQRVPVKIQLAEVPEEVKLVVGTTASVLIRSGGATGAITPAPAALQ